MSIDTTPLSAAETRAIATTAAPAAEWVAMVPVPDDAPPFGLGKPLKGEMQARRPDAHWTYRNAAGKVLGHACRWNLRPAGKDFSFAAFCQSADGRRAWKWKHIPAPRPLFNLDKLAASPDAPVVLVEGEKCAMAAARVFPQSVATCWIGGAGGAAYADFSPLYGRANVLFWPDADAAGASTIATVVKALAGEVGELRIVDAVALASLTPDGRRRKPPGDGWDVADALDSDLWQPEALRKAVLDHATVVEAAPATAADDEGPQPLRRAMPPPAAFPIDALGPALAPAAMAIIDRTQCPAAIAGNSVLAAAALAVQGHADIKHPIAFGAKPVSLFLITVAASGERKSAADSEALAPVSQFERELREAYREQMETYQRQRRAYDKAREKAEKDAKGDYQATLRALEGLGPEPVAPLFPALRVSEPTYEGLIKTFIAGRASLALFSDEGGGFVGGNAMAKENKLKTMTGLSRLWDGSTIDRIRVGDGQTIMSGKRLSAHLMMQELVAAGLLADELAQDQGFLSRVLVTAPASTAGTRFHRNEAPQTARELGAYHQHMLAILRRRLPIKDGSENELAPHTIELSAEAKRYWIGVYDGVEREVGRGGRLEMVRGLGSKLPEHCLRIAAVLALAEDIEATTVSLTQVQNAALLVEHYASEAVRLWNAGATSQEVRQAERLLEWLRGSWPEPYISTVAIYQRGPSALREKSVAEAAIATLVDHRHLVPADGVEVQGRIVKRAWRIVRGEAA